MDQVIHALLLVGGFAGSEYLKQRVEVRIVVHPSVVLILDFVV